MTTIEDPNVCTMVVSEVQHLLVPKYARIDVGVLIK